MSESLEDVIICEYYQKGRVVFPVPGDTGGVSFDPQTAYNALGIHGHRPFSGQSRLGCEPMCGLTTKGI